MKKVILKSLKYFLILAMLLPMACKKENKYHRAFIIDGGETEKGGCGWLVHIKEINHKARNLPDEYKVDRADIRIKYTYYSKRVGCNGNASVFDEIYIEDIK